MTTLAKIVAGGLPGGAVVGKREHHVDDGVPRRPDVGPQPSAWPRTARSTPTRCARRPAIATLELVADGSLHARANKLGDELRAGLSEAMKRAGVPGLCFGEASIFHVSFEGKPGLAGFDRPRRGDLYQLLRCALLNNGVDCASAPRLDLRRPHRRRHRAHGGGLREGAAGHGRRRQLQGDVGSHGCLEASRQAAGALRSRPGIRGVRGRRDVRGRDGGPRGGQLGLLRHRRDRRPGPVVPPRLASGRGRPAHALPRACTTCRSCSTRRSPWTTTTRSSSSPTRERSSTDRGSGSPRSRPCKITPFPGHSAAHLVVFEARWAGSSVGRAQD